MGLIAPNGPRKVNWDWFILLLCFYTAFSVPFQIGFYAFTDLDASPAGFAFDIIIDVLFILDFVSLLCGRTFCRCC